MRFSIWRRRRASGHAVTGGWKGKTIVRSFYHRFESFDASLSSRLLLAFFGVKTKETRCVVVGVRFCGLSSLGSINKLHTLRSVSECASYSHLSLSVLGRRMTPTTPDVRPWRKTLADQGEVEGRAE